MNSILNSVKALLGIDTTDTAFDTEIMININMVFATLNQLGIGPLQCYSISSSANNWTEFTNDAFILGLVRTYVYLKVKLLFDPPAGSAAAESMNKVASELEWRMYAACDVSSGSHTER